MNYNTTLLLLLIIPLAISAQQPVRKNLKGKIVADANNLDQIYVLNLKIQDAAMTHNGGFFVLPVAVGDTLMLSSTEFKAVKVVVKEEDLSTALLLIKMQPLMHQLNEVMVFQYKNINAVALGIIPKGQRTYTPAERKLRTATGLDAKIGLNTSLTIDPLFNMFSGRTAMLKKELVVERKEFNIDKIQNMFTEEFFTGKLKIPSEYIKGFEYYLVENNKFVTVLNTKNKPLATFMMGDLAAKYLEIIDCEKK